MKIKEGRNIYEHPVNGKTKQVHLPVPTVTEHLFENFPTHAQDEGPVPSESTQVGDTRRQTTSPENVGGKHVFIARPKARGASDTPLANRFTDGGVKLAAATRNWGVDCNLGGNKCLPQGRTPEALHQNAVRFLQHLLLPESPMRESNWQLRVILAARDVAETSLYFGEAPLASVLAVNTCSLQDCNRPPNS